MLKKSMCLVLLGLGFGVAHAQVPPSATAEIRFLLNEYRQSALTNSQKGMGDWIQHNVVANFLGVTTPTMATYDKRNWYDDVMRDRSSRCSRLTFEINSVSARKGIAVVRMNIDFRGSRMQDGRRRSFRIFGSYRDTWRWMDGRWMLDTDEERAYKEWSNGKLTVSKILPEK